MSLYSLVARSIATFPDRGAVTDHHGSWNYRELGVVVDHLASALEQILSPYDPIVAISLPRDRRLVPAILAVLKLNRAYLPVDPSYPQTRREFLLSDSGARWLIIDDAETTEDSGTFALGYGLALMSATGSSEREAPVVGVLPEDLAYIIYTSGTSGVPKGCIVTHRNVLALLESTAAELKLGPQDTWTMFHSYSFDFSVWEMFGALTSGGRLVVVDAFTAVDPAAFGRCLAEQGVTILSQVPSALSNLLDWWRAGTPDWSTLRYVVLGGESMTEALVAKWFAIPTTHGCELINMYGITETTVHVTLHRVQQSDTPFRGGSPIGRPLAHLRVDLRNVSGQPVVDDEPGEMWVQGAGVCSGYLNRPDLTQLRFGDGYYRSGDWAKRDAATGGLLYLGRRDRQVKVRGYRVELEEIERVAERLEFVSRCVCDVVEGELGTRLEAWIVLLNDTLVSVSDVRRALAELLPSHARPSRVHLVDAIPLTANGKVARDGLHEQSPSRGDS